MLCTNLKCNCNIRNEFLENVKKSSRPPSHNTNTNSILLRVHQTNFYFTLSDFYSIKIWKLKINIVFFNSQLSYIIWLIIWIMISYSIVLCIWRWENITSNIDAQFYENGFFLPSACPTFSNKITYVADRICTVCTYFSRGKTKYIKNNDLDFPDYTTTVKKSKWNSFSLWNSVIATFKEHLKESFASQ